MDTRDIVEQLQDACDLAMNPLKLERLCGNAKIEIERLRDLCRQLYEAEQTKNQQDWTAVIRALEKVGADDTARRPTANN